MYTSTHAIFGEMSKNGSFEMSKKCAKKAARAEQRKAETVFDQERQYLAMKTVFGMKTDFHGMKTVFRPRAAGHVRAIRKAIVELWPGVLLGVVGRRARARADPLSH